MCSGINSIKAALGRACVILPDSNQFKTSPIQVALYYPDGSFGRVLLIDLDLYNVPHRRGYIPRPMMVAGAASHGWRAIWQRQRIFIFYCGLSLHML